MTHPTKPSITVGYVFFQVSVMPIMVVSMYSEFLTLVVLLLIIRELKK